MVTSEWAKHDVKEVLEEAGLMPDILDQASLYESKTFEISKKRLLDETICKEKKFKRTCGDKFLHSTMR
ncbi:unnamed protein product [Bemisia tabaci]|uniref:Uncharacterized protein n=1 Tax=Bemisia tabaci TaxID=7038 RepID=A0A9P0F2Z5_BEMTA|nr:unnamed protein product [Bemisia tabaci]